MPVSKRHELGKQEQEALKKFEEITSFHRDFIMLARDRYRAYRGLIEKDSNADNWESKLHPPYVKHIVETQVASLMEDKLRFRIRPRPKFYSPEEQVQADNGAKAHEIFFRHQLQQDRFHEKQRDFVLQNLIVGVSVAKTFWKSENRKRKKLEVVDVGMEQMGMPNLLFDLREAEAVDRVYDGPCTEVVNVEDFFWHEAAIDIQRSPIIAHRVWRTFEELKQLEKDGTYYNIDELKESRDFSDEQGAFDLDDRQRTKDMIEELELWWLTESGIKTCTLGNRKVCIKECRDNPFWHGEYPFVSVSTSPDLFKVQGNSLVGNVAHLQDAAHDMLNQSVDNMKLQNNFIVAVDTTRVDPDNLEREPGAQWEVEGPINEIIQQFIPNTVTAQVALPYIGMLENNMQNLAGGHPFTTTSEAGRQGSDTATEASLVSNIAQASAKQMKLRLNYAYERIGQQRLQLNQQFIRRPVMVETIGLDQASEFVEIAPWILQGDQSFDLEPMSESLMRQERRAEANAMLQTFTQIFQPWLMAAQAGGATPPNFDAFVKQWLKEYVDDSTPFFSAKPPPPIGPPGQGGPGQQPQQPQQPGPGGVTASESTNPVNSPSNSNSISPIVDMQRYMAQGGGANNAG